MNPHLADVVIVGGFLGSGKTTLISQWINWKKSQGKKPGVIVNDLSNNLVDQQWFLAQGHLAQAIWGKCMCTSIGSLWETIEALLKEGVDSLFLEPVGSHLDLSQQVLPALLAQNTYLAKDLSLHIYPITIIIDGPRILQALEKRQASIQEMIQVQLQGADIFFVNKCDLLTQSQKEKLREFLKELKVPFCFGSAIASDQITSFFCWVDSNNMAPGGDHHEKPTHNSQSQWNPSHLNWLSMNLSFSGNHKSAIQGIWALTKKHIGPYELGHVKLFLQSEAGWIKVNQTSWDQPPSRQESITHACIHWKGILNLRCFAPKSSISKLRRELLHAL